MHAAVDLESIVVEVRHVVVIEVDGHRTAVPFVLRRVVWSVNSMGTVRVSVGLNVDPVMEIRDVVICDDVTGPVKSDGSVRRHYRRELLTVDTVEWHPEGPIPSKEVFGIVTANEVIICDVEVG